MHVTKRFLALVLISGGFLATGCVTSGTHEALQKEYDETKKALKADIDKRDAQIKDLEGQLEAEEAELASVSAELDQKKATLASTQQELEATNAQLTTKQEELSNMVKSRSALRDSVKEMQTALAELQERKRAADKRVAQFRDLINRFKPLIDTGKLSVRIVDGRMVVQLATDILFRSGSADLSKPGKEAIVEVTQVLASVPGRTYQVEGHTDNVPIRTAKYPSNWELASARAVAVARTMVEEGGVAPNRVSTASYAEYKPAASNETKEGRAQNRRIEIVVVPDLSGLPGFDELQKAS